MRVVYIKGQDEKVPEKKVRLTKKQMDLESARHWVERQCAKDKKKAAKMFAAELIELDK